MPHRSIKTLTKEQQEMLTPQNVMFLLKDGNVNFARNALPQIDNALRLEAMVDGQYPIAAVLACVDSRLSPNSIFNMGIGDLFVLRTAGNVVNVDILGSLEYACHIAGAKVVLVLGHSDCGAVCTAIEEKGAEGNLGALLDKIRPAIDTACDELKCAQSSKDGKFTEKVCVNHVQNTIDEIRANSPILVEMEKEGNIIIAGGYYDLETGRVDFLDKKDMRQSVED